jgi:hypothetical protein
MRGGGVPLSAGGYGIPTTLCGHTTLEYTIGPNGCAHYLARATDELLIVAHERASHSHAVMRHVTIREHKNMVAPAKGDAMREDDRQFEDQDENGSLNDVVAQPLAGGPTVPLDGFAPAWTRRLTSGGKLRRGLITSCAVALAIVTVLAPSLVSFVSTHATLVAGRIAQVWALPTPTERPEPVRTARSAAVAQPADSAWTALPLPPGAIYSDVVASPLDPRAVFACVWPSADVGTYAQLWQTHDAGANWSTLPLPAHSGEDCALSAPASSGRIIALLLHSDNSQPACAASWLYVSDDSGATWRRAAHPPIGPSGARYMRCEAWGAGKHLYFQTWYSLPSDLESPERALLERSDDDGRSWSRIDQAFAGASSIGGPFAGGAHFRVWPLTDGETLLASVVTRDGSAIWLSRDAGRNWVQTGMIAGIYTTNLVLDTSAYQARPAADRPAYALSNEQLPEFLFRLRVFASADGAQWTPLPPLPVPGATPARTGLIHVGATARGGLLALGVNPQTGVPPAADQDAALKAATAALWIWRWDPRSATWTPVATTSAGCAQCQLAGATARVDSHQATPGTYIWLEDQAQGAHALYRAFLATQSRATRGT